MTLFCSCPVALTFCLLSLGAQDQQTPPLPPSQQAPPQTSAPVAPEAPQNSAIQPPASSARIVDIPLQDCSGMPCIDMTTASGKTLRLLIDTADVHSYIGTTAAQNLGLDTEPLKAGSGSAVSQVQQTFVPGAKIGDLPMGDFPFMVMDTTTQPEDPKMKPQPLPADGALAFTAFNNRLLQIDYAHHVVHLSEPQDAPPPCPQSCTDLVVKRLSTYGPDTLTTSGFSVNGQPVDAQLDTLFTGTMLVYPASVKELGLKKDSKAKQKEFFPFLQGGMQLARFDGADESYQNLPLATGAPLYFMTNEDNPVTVPFDVTVGSGLLAHSIVSFDFKGNKMWLQQVQ